MTIGYYPRRFTNWAAELEGRAGLSPVLVGYTDAPTDPRGLPLDHGPGRPGRLSALSVFHRNSVLYGISVWARRARA